MTRAVQYLLRYTLHYPEYTLARVNSPFSSGLSSYRKRPFSSLEFLQVHLCRTSTAYIHRSYRFASFASRITDHIHITDIEHCPIRGHERVRILHSSFCPQSGPCRKCTCLCLCFNVRPVSGFSRARLRTEWLSSILTSCLVIALLRRIRWSLR